MNEFVRKLLHIAVLGFFGLLGILFGFPPVAVGSILFFALFALLRVLRVRTPAHRVARVSYGELCLPFGVLAAAYLALPDEPAAYLFALSALACADTAAALVGARVLRGVYRPWGERKTIAGSTTFFLVTLWCGVMLGFSLPPVVAAACAGTLTDALVPRGFDNAAVPIAIVFVLQLLG